MSALMEFYVEQHPAFALGNFVNVTPTIYRLWLQHKKPIPVWFGTDYVREAYEGCPLIEVIDSPKGKKMASSAMICTNNSMPDYKWVQNIVFGNIDETAKGIVHIDPKWDELYYGMAKETGGYTVFLFGSGNESPTYVASKSPDLEVYNRLAKESYSIFTGSANDMARVDRIIGAFKGVCIGNIRQSIALIRHAERVVANDTGLAHIAGVLNKELHVMFKDTLLPKNANMGQNTLYYTKGTWGKLHFTK